MNTPSHIPKLVAFYANYWPAYVSTRKDYFNTFRELRSAEQEALREAGIESYWPSTMPVLKGWRNPCARRPMAL